MKKKQSEFIEDQSIPDTDYLGFFSGDVNRKITWSRVKTIIFDFLAIQFLIGSPSTVLALSFMSLPVNASVRTKGCLTVSDGGGGLFLVLSPSGTPNGYSRILLQNGNHAVLQGPYNVLQFGAVRDGVTGCRSAIQRACDYMATNSIKMKVPKGVYRLESSSATTYPAGGRASIIIGGDGFGYDNWSLIGEGKYNSTFLFDPADMRGARMFDISNCNGFTIRGLGFSGKYIPVVEPVAFDGTADRAINATVHDQATYEDLYINRIGRYGMAFERGPFTNSVWRDIVFDWIGNDGIDMKSNNTSGVYQEDINYNNLFEDLIGLEWGNLTFEAPSQLLDMRCCDSVARRIIGYSMNNQCYLIRAISGARNTIKDPLAYGSSNDAADEQSGILVGAPDVKIINPRLYNLNVGIITAFNTADGRQPSFIARNVVIDSCFYAVDATVGDPCHVSGGKISNTEFRGIVTGNNGTYENIVFDDNAEAIRVANLTSGNRFTNCRKVSGGGLVYSGGGATADLNTIVNCGDLVADYNMDFVGRRLVLNGAPMTLRSTKFSLPIGAFPSYADDAAAAAGGLDVGDFYRTASAIKIRVS